MWVDFLLRSYEEWLNFVIRSTDDEHKNIEAVPEEPLVLVDYFGRVCASMADICGHYSWNEIDRLIWKALCNPFEVGELVTDPELALEPRLSCIDAMVEPFEKVVASNSEVLDKTGGFYMWWDIVCGDFCAQHGYFEDAPFTPKSEESRKMHDKLLEVLDRILQIPDRSHPPS